MQQVDAEMPGAAVGVGESLTVGCSAQLRRQLLTKLAERGDLVIDVQGVREVDVAGLQLLCAAHRSALAAGKNLVLRGVGEVLGEALRVSGLAAARGCDARCPWQQAAGDG